MRRSDSFSPADNSPAMRRVLFCSVLLLLVGLAAPLRAQSLNDLRPGSESPLVPQEQAEPKLTATMIPQGEITAGSTLVLAIQAELPVDAYTYSQNPAFGGATKIQVTELSGLEAIDETFTPDHPPKVAFEELFARETSRDLVGPAGEESPASAPGDAAPTPDGEASP